MRFYALHKGINLGGRDSFYADNGKSGGGIGVIPLVKSIPKQLVEFIFVETVEFKWSLHNDAAGRSVY